MKTKFQFSLVLVFVFVAFTLAQTHRLYYSVFSKRYIGMEGYYKEMIVTDINKDNIKSYAADYIKYDSINKNSKTEEQKEQRLKKIEHNIQRFGTTTKSVTYA